MFTGIIVTVGKVTAKTASGTATRFEIEAPDLIASLGVGDSVSCEGVCLTVESLSPTRFNVCAVQETLALTNLSDWEIGTPVNLEPAMQAGTRLGGHFVLGHVDGIGISESFLPLDGGGGEWRLRLPDALRTYCVSKGSITVCGTSLTIAGLEGNQVRIALIPHTLSHTTLGGKKNGDKLNIEVDILAKHVASLLAAWKPATVSEEADRAEKTTASRLTLGDLSAWGYAPASAERAS